MVHSSRRGRVATFFGMAVVIILAQMLRDHQIEPFSWMGLGIIVPTLLLTALFVSFIMHST